MIWILLTVLKLHSTVGIVPDRASTPTIIATQPVVPQGGPITKKTFL